MENEIKEAIKELANKSKTSKSHEALHETQAALNLAQALQVLSQVVKEK